MHVAPHHAQDMTQRTRSAQHQLTADFSANIGKQLQSFRSPALATRTSSVDQTGEGAGVGEADTHYRGPSPDYVVGVFVFLGVIIICRTYKLTLSGQEQVILQLTFFLVLSYKFNVGRSGASD